MTKAELIDQMAKDAEISKAAAGAALDSFMAGVAAALKKKDGKVTLRILVDRPTMEFFMADGYAYKLHERKNLSGSHLNKITFSAEVSGTDKVLINNFKVYPMKSILKKNGE